MSDLIQSLTDISDRIQMAISNIEATMDHPVLPISEASRLESARLSLGTAARQVRIARHVLICAFKPPSIADQEPQ